MIPDVEYGRYAPTVIQVDSLKINVHDSNINDDPWFLTDQQSLIVGRQKHGLCNTYNMIVDHEGVMINAPLSQRTDMESQYSLYVDGNVYVTGDIIAGGSNFQGLGYDPNGLFSCVSDSRIAEGLLVEVTGQSNASNLVVRPTSSEFSKAIFGVCSSTTSRARNDGKWALEVQTAGIALVKCKGPISVGDMLTSSDITGVAKVTTISGEIIDTAMHNYTIGKALQDVPQGRTLTIRCLMNVIQAPPTSGVTGDGYWELGYKESANIFYAGNVTIGNNIASRSNTYALNIMKSSDRTVDHAHINMENTMDSSLRIGIIGTSALSPAVVAVGAKVPGNSLEFHAGRTQEYFKRMYTKHEWNAGSLVVSSNEVPDYEYYNTPEDAPHVRIGSDGNVGIHTSFNPMITYTTRTTPAGLTSTKTEPAALHVQGTMYASNMLIWDYDTSATCNIDDLYVRRKGVTHNADSIIPGAFADGGYYFKQNLGVGGRQRGQGWDPRYALNVLDDARFASNVYIENTLNTNNLVSESSEFLGDVRADNDVIIGGTLRLESGIMMEVLKMDADGLPYMTWEAVDFRAVGQSSNQFFTTGNGLTTRTRLGVGMPESDTFARNNLRSQLAVNKVALSSGSNIWEFEMKDLSKSEYTPVGWIGHPTMINDTSGGDASLFFATPCNLDPNYRGLYNYGINTNMYFYPGRGTLNGVDVKNPPTMSIIGPTGPNESYGKVGIGTKLAPSELSVWGSITFTDKLTYYNTSTRQTFNIGLWKSGQFMSQDPSSGSASFTGIQYNDSKAPYVGINVLPDANYGVVMGSNVKVVGGYYDQSDSKMASWYDGTDGRTQSNQSSYNAGISKGASTSLFTWGNVGIGVNAPSGNLDIKNNLDGATILRLLSAENGKGSSLHFKTLTGSWRVSSDDQNQVLDMAFDASNIPLNDAVSTSTRRPLWMTYDSLTGKPQTFIGCSRTVLNTPAASAIDQGSSLIVDGGISVIGNVNITGSYTQSGQIMLNPDPAFTKCNLNLGVDDVYIGGGHVLLNPTGTKTVIIGDPSSADELINQSKAAMLRVYQTNNDTLASFRTTSPEGLIEIFSKITGDKLRFGVLNPFDTSRSNCPFAFLDGKNGSRPYLAFKQAKDGSDNKYVGFGTFDPQAMMHVSTSGTGSNMFKLTTQVNDQVSGNNCPEMVFEVSSIGSTPASTSWTMTGPSADYYDKLSLRYKDENDTKKEVFCFTNNGCIGIGTTTPQYALDVANVGGVGGLRLANSGAIGLPQILLQSGNGVFGEDYYLDYRMYASNSEFKIESVGTANNSDSQPLTIMHSDSNGNVGLCTQASNIYQVNVGGVLNVTDAILLNGNPLFSTSSNIPTTSAYLQAKNVYLQPNPSLGGGLHINTDRTVETGNLIYVQSGANPNMLLLDSTFTEAQVHLRTRTELGALDMWRMGTETRTIYWELYKDCEDVATVTGQHEPYLRAFSLTPSTGTTSNEFEGSLNGRLSLTVPTAGINLGKLVSMRTDTSCNLHLTSKCVNVFQDSTSTSNILSLWDANRSNVTIFNRNGYLGIGTSPRSALDINSGQVFGANGTLSAPTYSFASNTTSGILSINSNIIISAQGKTAAIFTNGSTSNALCVPSFTSFGVANVFGASNGQPGIVVDAYANVGIGTSIILSDNRLHIESNVVLNGHIRPFSSNTWNLGSEVLPWQNAFVSKTVNVNGTVMSNLPTGDMAVSIGVNTPRLILGSVTVASNSLSPSSLSLTNQGTVTYPVVMNTSMHTSIESLRLTTSNVVPFTVYSSNAMNLVAVSSTAAPEAFVVQGNGLVGIGTMSPSSPLTISCSNTLTALKVRQTGNGYLAELTNGQPGGLFVKNNGYVGIGTSVIDNALQVVGSGYVDGNFIGMSNMYVHRDLVVAGNTFTRFDQIVDSDQRLKKDIRKIENALDKVCALTGYTYAYNDNTVSKVTMSERSTGLIAQEVLSVMPEAVGSNANTGMYGIEYGSLMGLVIEAIKDIKQELEAIKACQ